jgi:hypothetical protein
VDACAALTDARGYGSCGGDGRSAATAAKQ